MKREKRTMFILFLLAATLIVAPVAGLLEGKETALITNSYEQRNPAIWGDLVVWTDNRHGNWEIYLYDISTVTETRVTTDPALQDVPAIWGDRIVWVDLRNSQRDIYLYNISTETDTGPVIQDTSFGSAIWGNRIVVQKYWSSNYFINMYDISTETAKLVRTMQMMDYPMMNVPGIWDDQIVWEESRENNQDIYLYDNSTGTETRVTMNLASQYDPAIWGDRIVWEDLRNGKSDIYLYDISTETEMRVTTNASDQKDPAIWGDRIIWQDFRNGKSDIYLYDISTETEMQVPTNGYDHFNHAIWGDRIIWTDYRNSNGDIYMFEIYTAPVIASMTIPTDPQPIGSTINVIGTFSDEDMDESHTATWNWGDEMSDVGVVDEENCVVTGSHTYTSAGIYTLSLTVTDEDDISDTAFSDNYIVVYDPDGGFVTGGGWFWSPLGAYADNQDLEGKAVFGFVSKYKKGSTVPVGNTEFQFKVADLDFKSDSYEWLVIANHKAMYKGTGTTNSEGEYGFMLSAIDEVLTPSTDVDLFRIKIWNKTNDVVIYDNMIDKENDADPTTVIGGGSIVIHK